MEKRNSILFLLLLFPCLLFAGNFLWQKTNDGLNFKVANCRKKVSFYRNNIVRITVCPDGVEKEAELVIVSNPQKQELSYDESGNRLIVSSDVLRVSIDKKNGRLSFLSLQKRKKYIEEVGMGERTKEDSLVLRIEETFKISPQESLYGLGQFQDGIMDYRGKEIVLSQANEIAVVPFLWSTNGYGILWNNYSKTIFKESQNKMSFVSEFGDIIDYCLVIGESADQIISGYRQLTGKAPMFRKSAYGYWQSKERYKSFDELIDVVSRFRQLRLPIDNIVQDWQYWGDNSLWSSMYFDPYNYPNPAHNIKQLHELNVNLMCSVWPAVGKRSRLYMDLNKKELLFKPQHWSSGQLIDFYHPEAKEIYYGHLKRGLLENGVDAIWLDGTEPEVDNTHTQEHTEKKIKGLGDSYLGNMGKYLNTYSLEATKGIYEHYRADDNRNRLFILTRSAFAGQQRYGAVTWSGDIGASWSVMRKQISAGLNFCMAGIPYWTHDIGAFFPNGHGGEYPEGISDPAYCELYARWFQFGVFTPIFRSHGTGTPREVYRFSSDSLLYNSLRTSLNLRYRLLPYIYSNAWRVYSEDYTLMRALSMDFEDKKVRKIDNAYMFGPSLLVQPITTPMYYFNETNSHIVPVECLRAENGKEGVIAEYFRGKDLAEKVFETNHKTIDFNWGGASPEKLNFQNYSMRWVGKLLPPLSGEYELGLVADDGIRMWINDELIINDWKDSSVRLLTKRIKLERNKEYDICIEYYQSMGSSEIKFIWALPEVKNLRGQKLNTAQTVYLPSGDDWYDFWEGNMYRGGKSVTISSPLDRLPLFVKAGTILPMGPFIQYTSEKSEDPMEIRIYKGKDASFVLYEDDGRTYNYENGEYSTIRFEWDDSLNELSIFERKGSFIDMDLTKKFYVVIVDDRNGVGIQYASKGKQVVYNGVGLKVKF